MSAGLREQREVFHDFHRERHEVDRFHRELRVVGGLGLREQQQLVGEAHHRTIAAMHRRKRFVERGVHAVLLPRELQLRAEQRERRAQLMRGIGDEAALRGHLHAEPRDALIDRFDDRPQLGMQTLDANRLELHRIAVGDLLFHFHQRPQFEREADAHQRHRQHDHLDLPHELRLPQLLGHRVARTHGFADRNAHAARRAVVVHQPHDADRAHRLAVQSVS